MKQINELSVQPNEYGLDAKKANDLIGNLPVIKSEREILISQFNEVILLDIEDANTSKQARELRLKIQKNRTQGINKWHKEAKDMFLRGGQFVDAVKRFEASVNESMESRLEEIEKYAEIQEQKRIAELKEKRIKELEIYSEFVPFGIDLGILSDDEFTKLFNGSKLQYEAKLEEERKAEEERKRLEEIQKLHTERKEKLLDFWQFIENKNQNFGELSASEFSQLFDLAKKDKANYEEEQERIRLENERLQKERKKQEEKARREREEAEKKLAEERAEQEEALRIEREKQAKLEAELKAKKDAEEKAERERLLAEEKARKEEINSILSKLNNVRVVGNNVLLSNDVVFCTVKELTLKSIEDFNYQQNALLGGQEAFENWVNSFAAPTEINDPRTKEVLKKFEAFKKWALAIK